MFYDVFGDLPTYTYALLTAGYLCHLVHHGITHQPRRGISSRNLAFFSPWRRRLLSVLAGAGAAAIGAGYALMCIQKIIALY